MMFICAAQRLSATDSGRMFKRWDREAGSQAHPRQRIDGVEICIRHGMCRECLRPLRVQFPHEHRLPAKGCLLSVRLVSLLLEQLVQQFSEKHGMFIGLQQGGLQLVSTEGPKPECAGEEPAELLGSTQLSDADASHLGTYCIEIEACVVS